MGVNQLKTLEESLWIEETRFDKSYMNNIIVADFFEYGRSGKVYTREEILSHPYQKIRATIPLKNFQIHKITKNVYQVTYISEVGIDRLKSNRSSIWLYSNNSWKLKFHQGTPS
jgi:hypothetical protein